jgi:hypothetical protein
MGNLKEKCPCKLNAISHQIYMLPKNSLRKKSIKHPKSLATFQKPHGRNYS